MKTLVSNKWEKSVSVTLRDRIPEGYRGAKGSKVWCTGPTSVCNKENFEMAQRGHSEASTDVNLLAKFMATKLCND